MRIIYAKNYNEVRDLCHNVKESKPCPALPVFYDEASAAMQAMELSDAECGILAIGDTGAWQNF